MQRERHPKFEITLIRKTGTSSSDFTFEFATFLADVIEKYASVLEIDNAVSSTNDKNQQDAVDTALAA